jgi:hypothetical protein
MPHSEPSDTETVKSIIEKWLPGILSGDLTCSLTGLNWRQAVGVRMNVREHFELVHRIKLPSPDCKPTGTGLS